MVDEKMTDDNQDSRSVQSPASCVRDGLVSHKEDMDNAEAEVLGLSVVTQTCDLVRRCEDRPFVEVCPLVEVEDSTLHEIQRGRRPNYAFIPGVAERSLVADLDRVMTVEKSVVATWDRVRGCLKELDPQHLLSKAELRGLKYVLAGLAMDRARSKIRKAHKYDERMQIVCEQLAEEMLRSQEGLQPTQAVSFDDLLEEVTPQQRETLELKVGGLTHEEISKATGKSLNTIGRHLKRVGEVGMKMLGRDSNASS